MLGKVETLPTPEEVKSFINDLNERYPKIKDASDRDKHKKARDFLSYGDVESAWKLLLS